MTIAINHYERTVTKLSIDQIKVDRDGITFGENHKRLLDRMSGFIGRDHHVDHHALLEDPGQFFLMARVLLPEHNDENPIHPHCLVDAVLKFAEMADFAYTVADLHHHTQEGDKYLELALEDDNYENPKCVRLPLTRRYSLACDQLSYSGTTLMVMIDQAKMDGEFNVKIGCAIIYAAAVAALNWVELTNAAVREVIRDYSFVYRPILRNKPSTEEQPK